MNAVLVPDREVAASRKSRSLPGLTPAEELARVIAANLAWPPRTIGLRILDGEGREVFARQKADRRAGTTTRRHTTGSFSTPLKI
jgi:hypothetical protein